MGIKTLDWISRRFRIFAKTFGNTIRKYMKNTIKWYIGSFVFICFWLHSWWKFNNWFLEFISANTWQISIALKPINSVSSQLSEQYQHWLDLVLKKCFYHDHFSLDFILFPVEGKNCTFKVDFKNHKQGINNFL